MAYAKHAVTKHVSWDITDVVNDDEHVLLGNTLTTEIDWSLYVMMALSVGGIDRPPSVFWSPCSLCKHWVANHIETGVLTI